jgi:hypothetical protein
MKELNYLFSVPRKVSAGVYEVKVNDDKIKVNRVNGNYFADDEDMYNSTIPDDDLPSVTEWVEAICREYERFF